MKRRKRWVVAAVSAFLVITLLVIYKQIATPWQTVGDYRFCVASVEHLDHQERPWEPVHHEVQVTIRVERTDAYIAAFRRANGGIPLGPETPEVGYTPGIIHRAQLVTPDGAQLRQIDSQDASGGFALDNFLRRGQTTRHAVRLVFDNPDHEAIATLVADVHDGHDPLNVHTSGQTWPVTGTLRIRDIHIP